jgi:hypothetical protein
MAMAGVVFIALLLAGVTAFAALTAGEGTGRDSIQPDSATPIPLEVTVTPPQATPEPDFAWDGPGAMDDEMLEPGLPAPSAAPIIDPGQRR